MSVRSPRRSRIAVAGVAALVSVAGCSGYGGSSGGGAPAASQPASSAASSAGSGYGGGGGRYDTGSAAPAGGQAANAVTIVNFAFTPGAATVKVGTTVTWTNTGVTHTVTADDSSFDSGRIAGGASYSRTFTKAGTFAYHCAIHPSMTAQVVVTP